MLKFRYLYPLILPLSMSWAMETRISEDSVVAPNVDYLSSSDSSEGYEDMGLFDHYSGKLRPLINENGHETVLDMSSCKKPHYLLENRRTRSESDPITQPDLTREDVSHFCRYLAIDGSDTSLLVLKNCGITNEGLMILANSLPQKFDELYVIGHLIDEDGFTDLLQAEGAYRLKSLSIVNTTLYKEDRSKNRGRYYETAVLSEHSLPVLNDFLSQSSNLEELQIGPFYEGVTPETLFKALLRNESLKKLTIYYQGYLDHESVKALRELIKTHRSIEVISMPETTLPVKASWKILTALPQSETVKALYFYEAQDNFDDLEEGSKEYKIYLEHKEIINQEFSSKRCKNSKLVRRKLIKDEKGRDKRIYITKDVYITADDKYTPDIQEFKKHFVILGSNGKERQKKRKISRKKTSHTRTTKAHRRSRNQASYAGAQNNRGSAPQHSCGG